MGKVVYYTACTLDGFIADEDNSLEWLFEVPDVDDDGEWEAFIARIGTMAMGATTYEWVLEHERLLEDPGKWREWYGDMWNPGINTQIADLLTGRKSVDEFCAGCEAEAKKVRDDDSITKYTR